MALSEEQQVAVKVWEATPPGSQVPMDETQIGKTPECLLLLLCLCMFAFGIWHGVNGCGELSPALHAV